AAASLRRQRAAHVHAHLRLRRRARRLRRRHGRAHLPGLALDGLEPDHGRLRGGGDRRDGIDRRIDHHRRRTRARRGNDQVFLSGVRLDGGVHHHGDRSLGAAGGPFREGALKAAPWVERLGYAILVVAGLVAPFVVYPVFAMNVLCFALFASAFNLLLGYTGLLSFRHAAYLGAAGYVTGYACKAWGWPPLFGIALGTLVATALGYIIGSLAIRRSGIYFAMIT